MSAGVGDRAGAAMVSDRPLARRRRAVGRALAWSWIVVCALAAVGADCVASDRPLVVSRGGDVSVLPGLRGVGARGDALRAALGPDDWAVWPPIAHDPIDVRTGGVLRPLAAPSATHPLGTDDRGRDVAARLVHGARASLGAAALAAALALALTLALAALAILRGPATRAAILAACDVVATAPSVLLVIAVGGLTGARGVPAIALLVAVPRAADGARLLVAELEALLARPFAEAARALGARPLRVLVRHALPSTIPLLATATALTAASAVLAEAALDYLGLGAPPPTPSWGELLAQAGQHDLRWWLSLPAGLAITLTAAALLRLARR
jgi:peptide/nickel transport system permease protein